MHFPIASRLCFLVFCILLTSTVAADTPATLYVDSGKGDNHNPGSCGRPLRSISAALERLAEPLTRSVTIELAAGTYSTTGERGMPSGCLHLMRRMCPGTQVTIRGHKDSNGAMPVLAWNGDPMIHVVEGNWRCEDLQIGTGGKSQRRGVMVAGPAQVALRNVVFRLRSLSDAAIYAHRGGKVLLGGAIRINDDLHEHAGEETFSGIIADDHGLVQFVEREGASLSMGNGSLSASYYGVIRLGCQIARITCWTEQSNLLAVNNSGRIDLHNTTTTLRAKNPRNTPIGLEDDGHILAEGARIVIDGTNHNAIVLQKASALACNDIELRGKFATAISAMSGSVFVGGFIGDVSNIEVTTGASVNIEKITGKLTGKAIVSRCAPISLPNGNGR